MLNAFQPVGLVLNTAAGSLTDGDEILAWFRRQEIGTLSRTVEATAQGGASQAARELAEQGARLIVSVGGDGTLHQVLNGLKGWLDRVAITVLPGGTGNDFARGIGMEDALDAALVQLNRGSLHPIDLGECNGELFLNVVSMGVGAEITQTTSPELKRWLGRMAYLVTGLQMLPGLEPMHLRISTLEGQREVEPVFAGEAYYLAVANAAYAGGGVTVCPEARIDDGLLDLALVDGLPVAEMLRADLPSSVPSARRFEAIRVEADRELRISVDGEAVQGCHFDIRVRAAAMQLLVPLWTFDAPFVFSKPIRRNSGPPVFSNAPTVK